LPLRRQRRRQR